MSPSATRASKEATRAKPDHSDPSLRKFVGCFTIRARAAIKFALGRSATGQRLASSHRPLRWPLSRPALNVRKGTGPAEIRLVRLSVVAIPPRNNRLWATHAVSVRRGSDAPSAGSRAPTPCRCRPCGGVAPPRLSLPCQGSRPSQRRDTEGTTSSCGDVPRHAPCGVPCHLQFRQQDRPCSAFALGRPWVDSRGGSDAPCGRKRRPNSGRRLSPAGTSLPPRSNSQLENGRAGCTESAGARGTSAHAARL